MTVELDLPVADALHEPLVAYLDGLDFDGFVQEEGRLLAYVSAARWSDVSREAVEAWLASRTGSPAFGERVIAAQNWNADWEASLQPVVAGGFVIKPSHRPAPPEAKGRTVIEIDPKMSFGTGYHESTRLVLRALPEIVQPGDRVLDAGTGTAILAIAAVKLGAASVIGFDIDPWARENAEENTALNGAGERVEVREGGIEVVPESGFDVILANINRNVLLAYLPTFAEKLRPGGTLALAGLLREDRDQMIAAAAEAGFTLAQDSHENAWWSGVWRRD
jgi:ribosomal protein L11 methyltransferase